MRFFIVATALSIARVAADGPTVDTSSGRVKGFSPAPGVTAFLGIPYAAPPVGELRFAPPHQVSAGAYKDTIDGTKFSASCWQFQLRSPFTFKDSQAFKGEQSEDCLKLNVWTPTTTTTNKKGKLPVMVWIHGGAWVEGTAMTEIYDGKDIVAAHPDVIVASLNYRLNIFGFPVSSALSPPVANLGLLDQRAAIEWLRKNIVSFGGDPDKMILFGESAGAGSISSYSYAYPDDPIVRGFIQESGTAEIMETQTIGSPGPSEFIHVSDALGCGGRGVDDRERMACMKKVDAERIHRAISNRTLNDLSSPSGGTPGIDNITAFSAGELVARGRAGRFAKLPTLIGSNQHEGDFLVPFSIQKGINYTLSDIVTKTVFTCPTARQALYRVKNGVPVYRYRYMPRWPIVSPWKWLRSGFHSSEIPFVFGTWDSLGLGKPSRKEREATRYMMGAWVAFAKDPEHGLQRLGWEMYNPKGKTLVQIFPDNEIRIEHVYPRKYDVGC